MCYEDMTVWHKVDSDTDMGLTITRDNRSMCGCLS